MLIQAQIIHTGFDIRLRVQNLDTGVPDRIFQWSSQFARCRDTGIGIFFTLSVEVHTKYKYCNYLKQLSWRVNDKRFG